MDDKQIGAAVRELVTAWLAWHEQLDQHERVAELEDRVEGYRVVDGGQTGSDGSWEITDADSGEVLGQGVGIDSYRDAWQPSWAHTDSISDDGFKAVPKPEGNFGLPAGLAQALTDWTVDRRDEAAHLIETSRDE